MKHFLFGVPHFLCPPSKKEGHIALQMSVRMSVGRYKCKQNLITLIERDLLNICEFKNFIKAAKCHSHVVHGLNFSFSGLEHIH